MSEVERVQFNREDMAEWKAEVARLTAELAEARKLCGESAGFLETVAMVHANQGYTDISADEADLAARLRAFEKGGK